LTTSVAFAQIDVTPIRKFEEELPNFESFKESDEEINIQRRDGKYTPPVRIISLDEIKSSGTQMGSVLTGVPFHNLENDKNYKTTKQVFIRYFNLEDENGFKYIQNK